MHNTQLLFVVINYCAFILTNSKNMSRNEFVSVVCVCVCCIVPNTSLWSIYLNNMHPSITLHVHSLIHTSWCMVCLYVMHGVYICLVYRCVCICVDRCVCNCICVHSGQVCMYGA